MNRAYPPLRLSILTAVVFASLVFAPARATTAVVGLSFQVQPSAAVEGNFIRSVPFDPTSGAVKVALVDGGGKVLPLDGVLITVAIGENPGNGTLEGTTAQATDDGVASFGDLRIVGGPADGYTLSARAPQLIPLLGAESTSFRIAPKGTSGTVCTGAACSVSASSDTASGSVLVDPSTPGALLMVALDFGSLDCDGYKEPKSSVMWFDYSGPEPKLVTYTINKGIVNERGNTGADHFELCFGSDQPFTTKNGAPAALDSGTGLFEGLLPDCHAKRTKPPCVISKTKDGPGNVVLTFKAGRGDPQAH